MVGLNVHCFINKVKLTFMIFLQVFSPAFSTFTEEKVISLLFLFSTVYLIK